MFCFKSDWEVAGEGLKAEWHDPIVSAFMGQGTMAGVDRRDQLEAMAVVCPVLCCPRLRNRVRGLSLLLKWSSIYQPNLLGLKGKEVS